MKDSIDKLAQLFKEFPGVGERQAKRFVFFLIRKSPAFRTELLDRIGKLSREVVQCPQCFRYFQADGNDLCDICASGLSDKHLLMVVEKDADIDAVRSTGNYDGLFFVLDGLIPISDEKIINNTHLHALVGRLAKDGAIQELILGFPMNAPGDHTDLYVRSAVQDITTKKNIRVTSLGRGLSTGTELEYVDKDTLKNALKNRA